MRRRSWSELDLRQAVKNSKSLRQVIKKIGLKPAGGNYEQVKKYLHFYRINSTHFRGKGWNKGLKMPYKPTLSLAEILVKNSSFQSYKLKKRLIKDSFLKERCEICGWGKKAKDGRIPVELDHINGHSTDNRLANLRILCPNCHSLQPTHRGRNIKK